MEQGIDILNIAINLAITAVIYILPPVIYAFLIRKGRLPQKSARTVCIISGLVIWFLLFFVYAALGLESGKRTIGPALIWSGVAYLIIRERNAPEGAVPEVKAEETAKSDMPEEAEPDAAAASEPESHENAALSKTPAVKKENFDLLVWAKRNIAAVVVIAVLAGAGLLAPVIGVGGDIAPVQLGGHLGQRPPDMPGQSPHPLQVCQLVLLFSSS